MIKAAVIFAVVILGYAQVQEGCGKKGVNNTGEARPGPAPVTTNINQTRPSPGPTGKPVDSVPLPENIKPDTKVRLDVKDKDGKVVSSRVLTVLEALNELKARYRDDRIIDGKGREIRFFEPLCRGVSAGTEEDEAARLAKEKELAELEKKYTVIVLHCDPSQVM